jgi:hypothetical protein
VARLSEFDDAFAYTTVPDQENEAANLLEEIFERMLKRPRKTTGEAFAASTGGVNLVDGKQTWELADDKKHCHPGDFD